MKKLSFGKMLEKIYILVIIAIINLIKKIIEIF